MTIIYVKCFKTSIILDLCRIFRKIYLYNRETKLTEAKIQADSWKYLLEIGR